MAQTYTQAFQKLLNEFILPYHSQHCLDGHVFREKYLLRTIIDHTLHANRKGFEAIYMGYTA